MNDNSQQWLAAGQQVLDIEGEALQSLRDNLDDSFVRAVSRLLNCKGKVVCTGVGKSGHIARKAAATLSSTGTPAFYLHPTEGGHGDSGVLSAGDVMLALSHSGSSNEVIALLPILRRRDIGLVVIAGDAESPLAAAAEILLLTRITREACPHNLAPTASTTAALALTDALAVALLTARGFSADDFARAHPSGRLGRRLLMCAGDVMRRGDDLPIVSAGTTFADALLEMTSKRMGMVLVADNDVLLGIFTDGDLRRAVTEGADFTAADISALMTKNPQCVSSADLAADALDIMRNRRINHLAVVDDGKLSGALSFHDLLASGI